MSPIPISCTSLYGERIMTFSPKYTTQVQKWATPILFLMGKVCVCGKQEQQIWREGCLNMSYAPGWNTREEKITCKTKLTFRRAYRSALLYILKLFSYCRLFFENCEQEHAAQLNFAYVPSCI